METLARCSHVRIRPFFSFAPLYKASASLLDLPSIHPRTPQPPPLAARILHRRLSSTTAQMEGGDAFAFGPYKINKSEVFFSSPLSYAMVNLRPVLPGIFLSISSNFAFFFGGSLLFDCWGVKFWGKCVFCVACVSVDYLLL